MTRDAKYRLGYWLGIVVALLTVAAYATAAVDDRYVRKSVYRVDVKTRDSAYGADKLRDSSWKIEQRAMTIDILCSRNVEPNNQRCRR